MTPEHRKNTTQAAAEKLAAVAAELEEAAATAPTPAQRLLLMRQWRKVQDAHDSLTRGEPVNTQSIPVQAPAAQPTSQEPLPDAPVQQVQLAQAATPVLLSKRVPRNVLVLGLVLPVWVLGCFFVAGLNSRDDISGEVALLYYQLGIPALVCAILAVVFGRQWGQQQRRIKATSAQETAPVDPYAQVQVQVGTVLGYIGLGVGALAVTVFIALVFSSLHW